jgi:glycosyltransferase involved in cell wall biosynthesis
MMSGDTGRASSHYAFLLAWPFHTLGGVEEVLRNLLHEFHSAGEIEPMAIEVSGRGEGTMPSLAGQPWPSICSGPIDSWNPRSPWRSLVISCIKAPVVLFKLRAICRRYSIRVLNPHFIGMEYWPLLPLRKLGLFRGKLVLSIHGSDIREMIQSRGLQRRLFRMLLRGADALVACSESLREEILGFVPECASRTVTIHNGIDAAAFLAPPTDPFRLPAWLAGRQIVLNIGAFVYNKGQDILLRAFKILRANHPNAALVIVGYGNSAAIAKLGVDLGIDDDLLLLENIPHVQIASLLKRADVFAFSTRWKKGVYGEGFGMALLEAGAAKTPIVTTLTGSAAEIIEDGVTGRIVPTEDPEALADAISGVLSDPATAMQMALRLNERVIEQFTWKHAYQKYVRLADGLPVKPAGSGKHSG